MFYIFAKVCFRNGCFCDISFCFCFFYYAGTHLICLALWRQLNEHPQHMLLQTR